MPLVWSFPDGHIEITTFTEEALERSRMPQETTSDLVLRLALDIAEKALHLQDGVPSLIRSKDMPKDRSKRDKWKLKDGVILET